MKKIIHSLLAGVAVLSLAACGSSSNNTTAEKTADSSASGKTEITWWAFP
ncbi:TPA: carbohydrate ABC transporter substrate-binding protein, partial [Streptococcus suis]